VLKEAPKLNQADSDWLSALEAAGEAEVDEAITSVLDRIDDLLEVADEGRLEILLQCANPEHLRVELSLAFLAGSLPVRDRLSRSNDARASLLRRLERRLEREAPSEVFALLNGLR